MRSNRRRYTHTLANLDQSQHGTADALELIDDELVATTLRGGGGLLARRRAVAGGLVAIAVESLQSRGELQPGVSSLIGELSLVGLTAAPSPRKGLACGYRGLEVLVERRLHRNAEVAGVLAALALLAEGAKVTLGDAGIGYAWR